MSTPRPQRRSRWKSSDWTSSPSRCPAEVTAPNSGAAMGRARLRASRIIRDRPIVPGPATFTAPGTGLRTAATIASSASSIPTSWIRGSKPRNVGHTGCERYRVI
jgi:hypothetical protein